MKESDGTMEGRQLKKIRRRQSSGLGSEKTRKREILEWSQEKQRSQGEASRQ